MCDDVMKLLMSKLELVVPPFKLKRRVKIVLASEDKPKSKQVLHVEGIDSDGTPYTLFTKVELALGKTSLSSAKEPFTVLYINILNIVFVTSRRSFQRSYGYASFPRSLSRTSCDYIGPS